MRGAEEMDSAAFRNCGLNGITASGKKLTIRREELRAKAFAAKANACRDESGRSESIPQIDVGGE